MLKSQTVVTAIQRKTREEKKIQKHPVTRIRTKTLYWSVSWDPHAFDWAGNLLVIGTYWSCIEWIIPKYHIVFIWIHLNGPKEISLLSFIVCVSLIFLIYFVRIQHFLVGRLTFVYEQKFKCETALAVLGRRGREHWTEMSVALEKSNLPSNISIGNSSLPIQNFYFYVSTK